jgi:Leucine-rich repeat (LRR) protein
VPEDLSNRQLLFLPADLFLLGWHRLISFLNLRRNSLQCRPQPAQILGGPKSPTKLDANGWLEDISKFPSLRQLNLADNRLQTFPNAIFLLSGLTELDLSGNRLPNLPSNIRLLTKSIIGFN